MNLETTGAALLGRRTPSIGEGVNKGYPPYLLMFENGFEYGCLVPIIDDAWN
jgi:hypothetical protein